MESFPVTPDGLEKMRAELRRLRQERPKVSQAIGDAIEEGDLKENAEYHAQKDKQGLMEARIRDLEAKISRAQVIDPKTLSGERIMFGATVTYLDIETDEEFSWSIVGEEESAPDRRLIAITSPLARALIGKEVGDEISIPGKGGRRTVEISTVVYQEITR